MKSFGDIFPVLAFILAALLAAGGGPASAAEQSKKLRQLQEEHGPALDGVPQKALPVAKQALALAVEEFGPDSSQADQEAYGVGTLAEAAGDFAEAARQYSDCVRVREILYGRESPIVANTLERLGHVLVKLGRFAEAEAQFSREIQIYRDSLGEDTVPAGAYSGLGAVKSGARRSRRRPRQLSQSRTQANEPLRRAPWRIALTWRTGSESIGMLSSASGARPRHCALSPAPMRQG